MAVPLARPAPTSEAADGELTLHTCSACGGDYEDPERSAPGGDKKVQGDDGDEGPNKVRDGRERH